ncbi:MAG: purine-nucleoside phosphorylase [Thermoanaerobaculia bacterium]
MDHLEQELTAAVAHWDELGWPRPDVLLVAGSGLSADLGRPIVDPRPWGELMPFEARGIVGHALEIEVLEPMPGRTVLYSRGRLHAYQGYSPAQVVFAVRLAGLLGVEIVIVTNSSGGLRPEDHGAGDLVAIRDQINLTGLNPLRGSPPAAWGPQFPDMTVAYDRQLLELLRGCAHDLGVDLGAGVYAGLGGPCYETPAEVRMLRALGADLVGMSTVLEVIAARHMGLRCVGLSLVSNLAAGVAGDEALDHEDVLVEGRKAAEKVAPLFGRLLRHPDLLTGRS